jgi:hypothetical protein
MTKNGQHCRVQSEIPLQKGQVSPAMLKPFFYFYDNGAFRTTLPGATFLT